MHNKEYIQACEENGWVISGTQNQAGQAPGEPGVFRTKFTQQAFLEHLINFIIADDQSLNVVECPEFRQLLLLLREDLQDKDIPRRTKIRESIIKTWHAYFKVLKEELAV